MTFKIMKERCDQCLFGPNKVVSNQRRAEILIEVKRKDSFFVCHKSSDVACHGDWEQNGCGQMGRIAGRLEAIEFVEVPK